MDGTRDTNILSHDLRKTLTDSRHRVLNFRATLKAKRNNLWYGAGNLDVTSNTLSSMYKPAGRDAAL